MRILRIISFIFIYYKSEETDAVAFVCGISFKTHVWIQTNMNPVIVCEEVEGNPNGLPNKFIIKQIGEVNIAYIDNDNKVLYTFIAQCQIVSLVFHEHMYVHKYVDEYAHKYICGKFTPRYLCLSSTTYLCPIYTNIFVANNIYGFMFNNIFVQKNINICVHKAHLCHILRQICTWLIQVVTR